MSSPTNEKPKKPNQILEFTKTDEELRQLAMDISDGKVFTDRHIREDDNGRGIQMIFMPIALGALADIPREELGKLGLIYEYLEKAGPRAVNGYPCFMSFQYLTVDQAKKVDQYWEEYNKTKEKFKTGV